MSGYDMSGLYEKLGIRYVSITSGVNKDSSKLTDEQMIREVSVEGRKRTYELTDAGKKLYDAECDRLRRCIRDADREEENV